MTQPGITLKLRDSARWLVALKPASWPKILVPAVLGQVLGAAEAGRVSPGAFAFGALFALLDVGFIVLLNDCADQRVDRIKRAMFPSGSKKTLADGLLPARSLWIVGALSGIGVAWLGAFAGRALDRPWLGPAACLALCVFAAYSLPPLRLNYRGGGELLEAAGVGFLLPAINAYAQSGAIAHPLRGALLGFVLLSLASAIASGLSDEESDRKGGKHTVVTRWGNPRARRLLEVCAVLGALSWALVGGLAPAVPWLATASAAGVCFWHLREVRARSPQALTNAFDAQRAYKAALHRAIWHGALVLAIGVALASAIAG